MKTTLAAIMGLVVLGSAGDVLAGGYKDSESYTCPWTGFYAGINGGYGWGTQAIDFSSNTASVTSAINGGAIPSSLANSPSGYLGGLQIGYNHELDRIVLGAEADYQITNFQSSGSHVNANPSFLAFNTNGTQQLQSLATLRGRVGMAPVESLLLYVTGGFAYGHTELTGTLTNPGCVGFCGTGSSTGNTTGWVAGFGAEYEFMYNWSVKGEYLYYDLGGQSQRIVDLGSPGSFLSEKTNFEGNLIRLGVNYKFM